MRHSGSVAVVVSNSLTSLSSSRVLYVYTDRFSPTHIRPSFGPVSGGTRVTVFGSGMLNVTALSAAFHGTVLRPVSPDSKVPVFLSPPDDVGMFAVVIYTHGVSVAAEFNFEYVEQPILHLLDPSVAPPGGGNIVTVMGKNFRENAVGLRVGVQYPSIRFMSSTHVAFPAPPSSPGTVAVEVITTGNDDTTQTTLPFLYVADVEIHKVSPTAGSYEGGDVVTMYGEQFSQRPEMLCRFGSRLQTTATVLSASTLLCNTPPAQRSANISLDVGRVGVGYSSTKLAFSIETPTLTTIAPSSGSVLGGTQ
eukprot:2693007-Rhodomonas_salina.1